MGYDSDSPSRDERDEEDEEDYEDDGGGNRFLGFMFGNVDNSGDLDADYLDEDAKEHLAALADKLGPSLTDIDLSVKSSRTPADTSEQDYDEKAEDAVDYEDIDEQYEGPEIQAVSEEDYLLPKKEYFSAEVSLATLNSSTSVFDDEDYDEDFENEHEGEQDKFHEVNYKAEKSADDLLTISPDNENLIADIKEISEEEVAEVQKEPSDGRGLTPLPVLCIEDGRVILRFSEIFGVHQPLKKGEKRHHRYSTPKDKYQSMDVSDFVEEDEEAFLKGSGQTISYVKQAHQLENQISALNVDDEESDKFGLLRAVDQMQLQVDRQRQSRYPDAEPMKDDTMESLNMGWETPFPTGLYTLDQQNWEDGIMWDDSPVASEKSAESCEISRHDLELSLSSEIEQQNGLQNPRLQPAVVSDDKKYSHFLPCFTDSLHPLGSSNFSEPTSPTLPKRIYHPQLLRLESHFDKISYFPLDGGKESISEEPHQSDAVKRFSRFFSQNREMLGGCWLDKILWESNRSIEKPKLILDLQDEHMLFEVLENKEARDLSLHAGAMIITRTSKSINGDSFDISGHGGQSSWRYVANDKHYSNRKTSQQLKSNSKKRVAHGVRVFHSKPALMLQTMKLKLSNKDLANFHRPKGLWYPHDNVVVVKEQGKLSTQGTMKIIVKSLGGKGSKLHVDAEETLSSVKTKASKKLDFKPSEMVKLFYLGKELEDHKSLAAQNVRPNSLLHLVRSKIHLLPQAQRLPGENTSVRPPGAFKKKSDLSVKDGHVFLMEYCEERPLLLSNAGMGARLCTYYQKSAPDDQTGSSLRNGNSSLGNVIILDPADKSPFLGDLKAGCSQSSLETNMYRAPIFSHKVQSTDYLLVRSAKGKLSLRRIDRIDAVGQQEPLMEVLSPRTKSLQNYMLNRLTVFICREFLAAEKCRLLPCIRADELPSQFPHLSDTLFRRKLKECTVLQRRPNGQLVYVKKRNFRTYPENILREMVAPEDVCKYESMQAGLYRLKHLGITEVHPAAISSAMSRLPDEAITLAAASHIERELQITPWNLSSNFVACTNQGKENIERLEITGVGDPSGRGLGFSYVRVTPKAPVSNASVKKKTVAGRGGTTVTGTDADLRRLSMEAAREVLLKFDVSEEQIAKMTRWHRIAMIRRLSSEQAASGVQVDPTTISKYARGQRMSFLQLQQQTREKCQEIWERQAQSLSALDGDENGSDSEGNSDLDSFAGDLENLLDAEECEDGEIGKKETRHDKVDGVKGIKMRRNPSLAQAEEEIEDEAAQAAELCKLLMDDDETARRKKKKTKIVGEEPRLAPRVQSSFVPEHGEWVKTLVNVQPDGTYTPKENVRDPKDVESVQIRKDKPGKLKTAKKIDIVQTSVVTKKLKIAGDKVNLVKNFKEKKNARESFVCGACGQLGHMRTNKNCPKYGEDVEAAVETPDPGKATTKFNSLDPSNQSHQKAPTKKLIPKSATKIASVEAPEAEKSGAKTKVLPVKFKCGSSTDKLSDNLAITPTQSSDRPVSSSHHATGKPIKVSKITFSNKMKPEDASVDSHKPSVVIRPLINTRIDVQVETPKPKPSVVIRPPAMTNRDQETSTMVRWQTEVDVEKPRKKFIFKRQKETIDLDPYDGNTEFESRKTKRMVELSSLEKHGRPERVNYVESSMKRKVKGDRRWWEEQERRENKERLREERAARRLYEEELQEEQDKLAEIKRYEAAIRRDREEEERIKANKKKKKKTEMKDEYMDEFRSKRNDKRFPERDRTVKRSRPVVELGMEYATPSTKRRRGGEVGLANILEDIVKMLKKSDFSLLFQKPVSKKEAPDYLDIVNRPMDLSTIKEKVSNLEYKSREDFRHDMWQITYNAHRYNDGRNPGIPPLADQLLELCDYLLNDRDDSLTEAEAGIERDT